MDKKQLVFTKLKPKVKAFGFNKKELLGIAALIANNLKSEEEALEEDVDAEINTQIEAVLPFLHLGQSQANRVIESWKKTKDPEDEDEDTLDSLKSQPNKPESDEISKAMKDLLSVVSGLKDEIKTLKGEKVQDKRRTKLESLLKDTGSYGTITMKNFSRMSFESDEAFNEYLEEVESDLKVFNQERANAGLKTLGKPSISVKEEETKVEPFTEAELVELAKV